jgi:hypothetical protein
MKMKPIKRNSGARAPVHCSAAIRREMTNVPVGSFVSLLKYLQHVRHPVLLGPEIEIANTGIGAIQAPKQEPRIMRHELNT